VAIAALRPTHCCPETEPRLKQSSSKTSKSLTQDLDNVSRTPSLLISLTTLSPTQFILCSASSVLQHGLFLTQSSFTLSTAFLATHLFLHLLPLGHSHFHVISLFINLDILPCLHFPSFGAYLLLDEHLVIYF
jgi:hypothetical protein